MAELAAKESAFGGDDRTEALLETARVEEAKREDEDAGAELPVKGTEAELAAKKSALGGLFSPPRDGDCLMQPRRGT